MLKHLACLVLFGSSAAACGSFGGENAASADAGADADAADAAAPSGDATADDAPDVDAGSDAAPSFGPPCDKALACDRVVFVTSEVLSGNFGGLDSADNRCAIAAMKSTIPSLQAKHFMAWLSDANGSPGSRFVQGTGKYVRSDGLVVAADWKTLTTADLLNPIQTDENGAPVGGSVWTATLRNGTPPSGLPMTTHCNDWTSARADYAGFIGSASAKTGEWSFTTTPAACSVHQHLYCFEQ